MGLLIDSSVLIAVERGQLRADDVAGAARPNEPMAIAAITASELLHGVHRLGGARRIRAERIVTRWLATLPVIPFDLEVAKVHATLASQHRRRGRPVGSHDLMIAATAVHLDYRVATRDRRSFARVDGLAVEYL
ncbi:MAG: PIN domain-containing protein [Gemmatimonadota bacterium]|nr:PIN domain-containing protein [Gemmatimonadota bacterium]MDE2782287.1 PIN domain-containing protein [Gemmatimonadota bacterium]MDE2864234.1 PIN domain-containing protein [Gemmatimonadota bacterium]MXV97019.1 type II toxin-antitoxin system VapC family toxin [Gemmatimonadota bacterium]MYB07832.1 type II toxin-antitoxin system VapC family toxin [Gemmatimonadota bacterium]